jgi:hypothetical protein
LQNKIQNSDLPSTEQAPADNTAVKQPQPNKDDISLDIEKLKLK